MPITQQKGSVRTSTPEVTSVGDLKPIWLQLTLTLVSIIAPLIIAQWNDLSKNQKESEKNIASLTMEVTHIGKDVTELKDNVKSIQKEMIDLKLEIQKISVTSKSGKRK